MKAPYLEEEEIEQTMPLERTVWSVFSKKRQLKIEILISLAVLFFRPYNFLINENSSDFLPG